MTTTGTARMLVAESAAVAFAFALVARSAGEQFIACVACVALITLAGGRWRGAALTGWVASGLRSVARPQASGVAGSVDAILAGPQGAVAIVELDDTDTLITSARRPLPRLDITRPDGPAITVQHVVEAPPARHRECLTVHAGGDGVAWTAETLRGRLESAVGLMCRRLDTEGITYHRLTRADLITAAAGKAFPEARNGPTKGVRAVRGLDKADVGPTAYKTHRTPHILLGHDRNGDATYLRIPVHRDRPVHITVIGGSRAARVIAGQASAAGARVVSTDAWRGGSMGRRGFAGPGQAVPLILDCLDYPTPADAQALTDADIVLCQPLPADAATIVAATMGLPPHVAGWLARIEGDMVALVGEGAVRWLMLASHAGLAGTLQT